MNDQQLYIDGQLVDTDEKTKITLNIKSNLLRDVSKMASNSTFTVKLPKTVRNQRIFEHADIVQSATDFQYKTHDARYVRNGVEIISYGRAVLLAATESFEITIVWGLFPKLTELISAGTTLNQLQSDAKILYQTANPLSDYNTADGYLYAGIDWLIHDNTVDYTWRSSSSMVQPVTGTGRGWTSGGSSTGSFFGGRRSRTYEQTTKHPVVRVPWLIDLIRQNTGIEFKWGDPENEYIKTLIVPLIARKSNELTFTNANYDATAQGLEMYQTGAISIVTNTDVNVFNNAAGSTNTVLEVKADANVILDVAFKWQFDLTGEHRNGYGTRGDTYAFSALYWVKMSITGSQQQEYIMGRNSGFNVVTVPNNWQGIVVFEDKGYGKIEVKQGDKITFEFCSNGKTMTSVQFLGGTIKATLSSDEDVPSGGYFPIAYNLPKIKVIDFVKFLAVITGTFPLQSQSSDRVVSFLPLAAVWGNVSKAVDWTRRIVPNWAENKPKELSYKLSDYGQNNWYKWKQDDTVVGNYDGDLVVEDGTLEVEKTIFEFPFAASDGNNVPCYEVKQRSENSDTTSTEDNEPSYKACKDRILRLYADDNGKAQAKFDINMQDILAEKYAELSRTLNGAKIIKERVRISNVELLQFDETLPVYLAQYGSYFAITEIKGGDNGYADVTMIQLIL